jgi:hypothetical protein
LLVANKSKQEAIQSSIQLIIGDVTGARDTRFHATGTQGQLETPGALAGWGVDEEGDQIVIFPFAQA